MPIPTQFEITRPLLAYASKHSEFRIPEAIDELAQTFGLTEDEKREMLESGRDYRFGNRVRWALQRLKVAKLVENKARGIYKVTARASSALEQNQELNQAFLLRYPEYAEFFQRLGSSNNESPIQKVTTAEAQAAILNPEEALEESYRQLRQELIQDLLEKVKSASPRFFESLVVDLLVAMGYGGSRKDAGRAVGQSGDGGIDGIIKEDRLGLDTIYIQAKRWQGTVGRPEIQAFSGSLDGARARKGVFITTSKYTRDALDYVERIDKKIILIDGQQLAEFMIDFGIGVSEMGRYIVKKVDHDYFEAE